MPAGRRDAWALFPGVTVLDPVLDVHALREPLLSLSDVQQAMNSSFTSTAICTGRNASKREMTYSQGSSGIPRSSRARSCS